MPFTHSDLDQPETTKFSDAADRGPNHADDREESERVLDWHRVACGAVGSIRTLRRATARWPKMHPTTIGFQAQAPIRHALAVSSSGFSEWHGSASVVISKDIFEEMGAIYENTDLVLRARFDLNELDLELAAAGLDEFPLKLSGGVWEARYEADIIHDHPSDAIERMLDLVERLSPAGMRLWEACKSRRFDIGYLPSDDPHPWTDQRWTHSTWQLTPAVLQRMAAANASLVVTIYRASNVDYDAEPGMVDEDSETVGSQDVRRADTQELPRKEESKADERITDNHCLAAVHLKEANDLGVVAQRCLCFVK